MAAAGKLIFTFLFLAFSFYDARASLYSEKDPMEILDNSTIKEKIYNSKNVWIVEFYSSWCGHCHAFAPTWKKFAKQIQSWKNTVSVGVIDCAEDRNLDTCRHYEIQSFPTVKLFDASLKNKSDFGVTFKGQKTIKRLRKTLVEFIEKQEKLDEPPDFKPADLHIIESFTSKRSEAKLLALVFEEKESYLGKELILDTSRCKKIKVMRVLSSDDALTDKFNIEEYPALILIDQKGSFKELSVNDRSRSGFLRALSKIDPGLQVSEEVVKKPKHPKISTDDLYQNSSIEVYMTDLVSSISYSLRREVPKMRVIKGDALKALKDWVNLLSKCTPAEPFLSRYLASLDKWLKKPRHDSSVTSGEWLKYIDEQQKFDSYLPVEIEWRGCKGSTSIYRGFPCSLWVLFHTMTVHCGTIPKSGLTGLEILKRIRGFIDYFFGCRYCRDHFVAMASNVANEVESYDDAILWLWERHNRVNARLASDRSTDPEHPKIQFPRRDICSDCRKEIKKKDNNTIVTSPGFGVKETWWNKRVVLEFLKKHYGPDNIRLRDKNPFTDGADDDEPDTVRTSLYYLVLSGAGLASLETSLCVIIYCTVMIIVLGIYFYLIKKRKKKELRHIV